MKTILLTLTSSLAMAAISSAASIAMNLAENAGNQVFAGGENIGPTAINSTYWNSSIDRDTGSLASGEIGSVGSLIDDTGASTSATVRWTSSNVYYNGDGTGTDEKKLAVGYLDDGGNGPTVTVSNIPYPLYSVYVLFTSDNNGDYQHGALTVAGSTILGGGNFNAHGRVTDGTGWLEADGTVFGNYALVTGLSDSTLAISSIRNGAARGPITGFVIQQVPEPSAALFLSLAGFALILRRRK